MKLSLNRIVENGSSPSIPLIVELKANGTVVGEDSIDPPKMSKLRVTLPIVAKNKGIIKLNFFISDRPFPPIITHPT